MGIGISLFPSLLEATKPRLLFSSSEIVSSTVNADVAAPLRLTVHWAAVPSVTASPPGIVTTWACASPAKSGGGRERSNAKAAPAQPHSPLAGKPLTPGLFTVIRPLASGVAPQQASRP